MPDAILYYFAQIGRLPSRKVLDAFAANLGFGVARTSGPPWSEWIERARQRARDFPQLPALPPYPSPTPRSWEALEIDVVLPRRLRRGYTHATMLEHVRRFIDWLPEGRKPTNRLYLEFSETHPDVISLNGLLHHAPLHTFIADLELLDAERSG